MAFNSVTELTEADIAALSDEDFDSLRYKVIMDRERREALVNLPAMIAQNAAHFRSMGGDEGALAAAIAPVETPEEG